MTNPKILIMDDEPANVMWLSDYLEDSGFDVDMEVDVNSGVNSLKNNSYRFAIIDLNIPVFPPLSAAAVEMGDIYQTYPGLYAAMSARTMGYRDRQIVVYTVHRDPGIAEETRKLGCTYIMKGRPKMLKDEIKEILSYDPSAE